MKSEKARLGTVDGRLTGPGTKDVPMEVGDEENAPMVRQESQEDTDISLADIPPAGDGPADDGSRGSQREGGDPQFVSDGSEDDEPATAREGRAKAVKEESVQVGAADSDDDKKKMGLNTTYDGFTIYGRILCLVVKRRGTARGKEMAGGAGQAMMEEWISSTQVGEGQLMDD